MAADEAEKTLAILYLLAEVFAHFCSCLCGGGESKNYKI